MSGYLHCSLTFSVILPVLLRQNSSDVKVTKTAVRADFVSSKKEIRMSSVLIKMLVT